MHVVTGASFWGLLCLLWGVSLYVCGAVSLSLSLCRCVCVCLACCSHMILAAVHQTLPCTLMCCEKHAVQNAVGVAASCTHHTLVLQRTWWTQSRPTSLKWLQIRASYARLLMCLAALKMAAQHHQTVLLPQKHNPWRVGNCATDEWLLSASK